MRNGAPGKRVRLVLDTNTVVSGLSIAQLTARFALLAQRTVPAEIAPASADPDDDHVLACALASQADLIVPGDSDLLNLKSYQGIPAVDAAEASARIACR